MTNFFIFTHLISAMFKPCLKLLLNTKLHIYCTNQAVRQCSYHTRFNRNVFVCRNEINVCVVNNTTYRCMSNIQFSFWLKKKRLGGISIVHVISCNRSLYWLQRKWNKGGKLLHTNSEMCWKQEKCGSLWKMSLGI